MHHLNPAAPEASRGRQQYQGERRGGTDGVAQRASDGSIRGPRHGLRPRAPWRSPPPRRPRSRTRPVPTAASPTAPAAGPAGWSWRSPPARRPTSSASRRRGSRRARTRRRSSPARPSRSAPTTSPGARRSTAGSSTRPRDGSGVTFVDELDTYSFTRPTQEDCEAVAGAARGRRSPRRPAVRRRGEPGRASGAGPVAVLRGRADRGPGRGRRAGPLGLRRSGRCRPHDRIRGTAGFRRRHGDAGRRGLPAGRAGHDPAARQRHRAGLRNRRGRRHRADRRAHPDRTATGAGHGGHVRAPVGARRRRGTADRRARLRGRRRRARRT